MFILNKKDDARFQDETTYGTFGRAATTHTFVNPETNKWVPNVFPVYLGGQYVMNTHIKDGFYPTEGRSLGKEAPVGQGVANVGAVVRRLEEIGYTGPLVIEREISGEQQIRDSLTFGAFSETDGEIGYDIVAEGNGIYTLKPEGGLVPGGSYQIAANDRDREPEFNADGKLVAGKGRYLEIGYYEWFAAQQHGDVRLTIDATSQAVSKKNITAITINTAFSMTDLSIYINGAGGTTQAFACYAVMDETPQVLASQHAVTVAKNGSKTVPAICNVADAVITYAVTTALTGVSVTNAGVISAGTTAGTAVITVTATYDTNKTVTDTITVTVPA